MWVCVSDGSGVSEFEYLPKSGVEDDDQAVTLHPSSANITIEDDDSESFYTWHFKTSRNAFLMWMND